MGKSDYMSCDAAVPWQIPVHAPFDPRAWLLGVGCHFQKHLPLIVVSATINKKPHLLQSVELPN